MALCNSLSTNVGKNRLRQSVSCFLLVLPACLLIRQAVCVHWSDGQPYRPAAFGWRLNGPQIPCMGVAYSSQRSDDQIRRPVFFGDFAPVGGGDEVK